MKNNKLLLHSDIVDLMEAIKFNDKLKEINLNLAGNCIEHEEFESFFTIFTSFPLLEKLSLNLKETKLLSEDLTILDNIFCKLKHLVDFSLVTSAYDIYKSAN